MNAVPHIPPIIRRLVPVLGSPVDGEALGACRAIGRVLTRSGLGFTELANAIPTGETKRADVTLGRPAPSRRTGPTRPRDVYALHRTYTPRQEAQHRARVVFCQSQPWRLTSWEREFLDNIARLHGNLSIRQGDRLAALTDRLDQEARRA